jgi:5'-3' exonuclease
MSKRLIVIDGHNFLWRSYAVPFRFSSARGTPLHVITTFLKLIRRSVAVLPGLNQSDHLIIVFDSDNGNENFSLSKDYKSNRKLHFSDTEDSPYQHLPHIKKALDYLKMTTSQLVYRMGS